MLSYTVKLLGGIDVKFKVHYMILVLLFISMYLAGCTNKDEVKSLKGELKLKEEQVDTLNTMIKTNDEKMQALEKKVAEYEVQLNTGSNSVLNQAFTVINILKNKDMNSLANYIHPDKGVRITPYSYIEIQTNLVFTAQDMVGLLENTQVYTWGEYDGSGDPINATFSDYYDEFIYDVDFVNANTIGNNTIIGTSGNMVNNLNQAYPNESFVEFHFAGFDAQYAGMDWKSLRLVFEDVDGTWYLVGIIHDQWTI
jgi:outer membrane murein-binding lipoprotein Lpp